MHRKPSSSLAAISLSGALLSLAFPAYAQDTLLAADEYRASCQVCHGKEGKGDGPMAGVLKKVPPDLTQLSKKNEGRFPFLKVAQVIDGRAIVPAHGTREMPVWGERYAADIGETFGPYGGERAVRARVLELVYYIQSLQQ